MNASAAVKPQSVGFADRATSTPGQSVANGIDVAADVLRRLFGHSPEWEEPYLRLGELLRHQGRIEQAIACYRETLCCNPVRFEALLALGAIDLMAGRLADASALLRQCCDLRPTDAQAWHACGISFSLSGKLEEAYEALRTGHAHDRSNASCGVHWTDAAFALGRLDEVMGVLEAEMAREPGNAGVLTARAAGLCHLGRRREAIDLLEAATLLAPEAAVSATLFADMLARSTRQTEAEPALRRALLLDPANSDVVMALSVVLMRLHRYNEAVDTLNNLLDQDATRVGALCNIATALVALGRQDEAVADAQQAMQLAPDHAAPYRALCNALPYHPSVTGSTLLGAARSCAARQPRALLPPCRTAPIAERRLRVGILSGTLRTHPVGWLTIAAFEHLDPLAFELICLTPNQPDDAIGRRFAAIASRWEDTGSLDDHQLAAFGRELGLDVLIDLGGYGDFGRMPALAHRMAPVQIKWVGMQNHSTGLAEMDWFITDRWETPAGFEEFYSERLLKLPDGYVCYSPPIDAPEPSPLPALRRGAVTFGCYNNLAKITPVVIDVWARILRRVSNARLVLKTHQFNNAATCEAMLQAFAHYEIDPGRIELRGSSPHRELLRQYSDIDIVLDPFPYSGGLTTCEALWMGVPTITLPGETFASRHSASHMSNVGLADWLVADIDAYVEQAVARASDLDSLSLLRSGLRLRTRQSPLCDGPRFGAALGDALRHTWHDWCVSDAASQLLTFD